MGVCIRVCAKAIGREGANAAQRENLLLCACLYESPESSHEGAEKGHIRAVD